MRTIGRLPFVAMLAIVVALVILADYVATFSRFGLRGLLLLVVPVALAAWYLGEYRQKIYLPRSPPTVAAPPAAETPPTVAPSPDASTASPPAAPEAPGPVEVDSPDEENDPVEEADRLDRPTSDEEAPPDRRGG